MGKDKKKPSVQAPVVEKPEEKKLPAEKTTVNTGAPGVPDGMSQHDKVLYGSLLQHRKDEMVRNGGESAEKYQALTMIEDAILIDVAVTELVIKKNPMSLILTANEKNYGAIKLLANEMGVNLPEFESLPKPTKEQLAAAGLTDAAGKVVLKLEDKNVSKETKEQKKKEPAPPKPQPKTTVWRCKVCGYEYVGETLPPDFECPLCHHGPEDFEKVEG